MVRLALYKRIHKHKIKKKLSSQNQMTAPQATPFTPQPGPNVSPSCESPEDCFALFFDDVLLDYIVDNTNKYVEKKIASMRQTKHGFYRNWRPVTREEMKGFIAVILNIGIIQLNDLKEYWSTDGSTNLPFFRSVFSHDRFFQIFGALHVGDLEGTRP